MDKEGFLEIISKLKSENEGLKTKILELEAKNKYYEERLKINSKDKFGTKSEKKSHNNSNLKSKTKTSKENLPNKNRKGKQKIDLSKLPVEKTYYEIPESERACCECGEKLHEMKVEVRREYKVIPARVIITEHHTKVYSCRNCEKNNIFTPIIKACSPKPLIKGSLVSGSMAAHIMLEKFFKAVPLARQEKVFFWNEIPIHRGTMASWIISLALTYLILIYDRMIDFLKESPVLHADETTFQVLKEPGKKPTSKSYMWIYTTGKHSENNIAIYEYQPNRKSENPKNFLKDFSGYLHCDGYEGYHSLHDSITIVGCWSHLRRKFHDAVKILPEEKVKGSESEKGLIFCDKIFDLERDFIKRNLTPEEIKIEREKHSKPIAILFYNWALQYENIIKSKFKDAITYFLNQWKYLKNIYLDGHVEISNNKAERAVKPFVIGRKNWLFSDSQNGARSSAIIYSMVETVLLNNLDPFKYLEYIFKVMKDDKNINIDTLLPFSKNMKEKFSTEGGVQSEIYEENAKVC